MIEDTDEINAMYVYMDAWINVFVYRCVGMCVYVCMYVCTYVRTYTRIYVCMQACRHACMHTCVYAHIGPYVLLVSSDLMLLCLQGPRAAGRTISTGDHESMVIYVHRGPAPHPQVSPLDFGFLETWCHEGTTSAVEGLKAAIIVDPTFSCISPSPTAC